MFSPTHTIVTYSLQTRLKTVAFPGHCPVAPVMVASVVPPFREAPPATPLPPDRYLWPAGLYLLRPPASYSHGTAHINNKGFLYATHIYLYGVL